MNVNVNARLSTAKLRSVTKTNGSYSKRLEAMLNDCDLQTTALHTIKSKPISINRPHSNVSSPRASVSPKWKSRSFPEQEAM